MSLNLITNTERKTDIMPAKKSDVKIVITAYGKSISLNCEEILFNRYRIKKGRSLSMKMPDATMCEVFNLARKWTVSQRKKNGKFNYGSRDFVS